MAAPKARPGSVERAMHLERVQEMLRQGNTTTGIAEATDRSPATITRDKKIILGRWQKEMVEDVDRHKAIVLKQVEMVVFEAWMAYTGQKPGGDPKYLRVILDAIKRKCAILGLDAPKSVKAEVTSESGFFSEQTMQDTMALANEICAAFDAESGESSSDVVPSTSVGVLK